eukprot:2724422-Alexandrium_andersonii.AAC.1
MEPPDPADAAATEQRRQAEAARGADASSACATQRQVTLTAQLADMPSEMWIGTLGDPRADWRDR